MNVRRSIGIGYANNCIGKIERVGKAAGLGKDHSHRRVAVDERELAGYLFAGAGPRLRRQASESSLSTTKIVRLLTAPRAS